MHHDVAQWCSIIAFQMRPAYHPEGLYDESKVASQQQTQTITQMWHQNGKCPKDTIPIRRTKKEDVLRASSVRRYGKKRHRSTPNPMSVDPDMLNESGHQVQNNTSIMLHPRITFILALSSANPVYVFALSPIEQHAIAYVEGDKYYGAKATINVWQPKIEQANEFSLSQLWILGGSFGQDLNSIEAGWQVRHGRNMERETQFMKSSIKCCLAASISVLHHLHCAQ